MRFLNILQNIIIKEAKQIMTKKKSTKRALISSLLILAMCFTMLAGTTFAWFTDSVTSANNIIKSGKLDMEVQYYDAANGTWETLDDTVKLFDDAALYEPGYTQVAYIKIANVGTLAFNYKLSANIVSETKGTNVFDAEFALSDYLKFGTVETTAVYATREDARAAVAANAKDLKELNANNAGYLLAPAANAVSETGIIALVIYMPEEVGNVANYKADAQPSIELGLNIAATQYTYESDSFNELYDAAAAAKASAANATELNAALATAKAGDVIEITADITDDGIVLPDGITIVGNGHQLKTTITGDKDIKLVNVDSRNVKVNNFTGTLEFDGGTLSTTVAGSSSNADAPFYCNTGAGTYIFKDMVVTAGATKGIKISKAKEVIIDGCVFDANNMNPQATDTHGAGQTQYDQRSMSMIDIQEQNTADQMKVTITNCTFVGAPQGALVGSIADTDTAGAIKLKAEEKGFESVTITGNTFTDCYRDVAVGVNVLISNGNWVGIKSPAGLTNAMNNVADTSVWHISGNTTNGDATHGFLIASNGTKAISDTVGEVIGGATVYYTYKTAKITSGMSVADVNALIG